MLKHFENLHHTCKLQNKCKASLFHIDFPSALCDEKCDSFVSMVDAINVLFNISTEYWSFFMEQAHYYLTLISTTKNTSLGSVKHSRFLFLKKIKYVIVEYFKKKNW